MIYNPEWPSSPRLSKTLPKSTWTPAGEGATTPSPWWQETSWASTLRSRASRRPPSAGGKETKWARRKETWREVQWRGSLLFWPCLSSVPSFPPRVVGGVRGRGTGPRGVEQVPEQLHNWRGGERRWGPLLHQRDEPRRRGHGGAHRQDRGFVAFVHFCLFQISLVAPFLLFLLLVFCLMDRNHYHKSSEHLLLLVPSFKTRLNILLQFVYRMRFEHLLRLSKRSLKLKLRLEPNSQASAR